ncbi:MAG: isoprenoid biosynthesis glyoxalase ElbB [bacterium]
MNKKVAVLLSGCGVFDGSEIQEATLTLYFLHKENVEIIPIAPDKNQFQVINHNSQNEMTEKRNILIESARIARGEVRNLTSVSVNDFDGLILPGGAGAATNLSDYDVKGRNCIIDPEVKNIIYNSVLARKPLGVMCISPILVAVALKNTDIHPLLTIGNDSKTTSDIEFFRAKHKPCKVDEIAVDENHRIVSTPAYMLGPGIADIAPGIEKLVKKVVEWL